MITITFDTDNAAFGEDFETECEKVLNSVKKWLADAGEYPLHDSYGNKIGSIIIERE